MRALVGFIEKMPPARRRFGFRLPFYGWAVAAFVGLCIFIAGVISGIFWMKG